jgi:hypothetical protein
MKPIKSISALCLLAFVAMTFSACNDKFDNPEKFPPVTLKPTHTIKELKALYDGRPTTVTDDVIVAGVVTTSDQEGNLYRELFIQDQTGGVKVKVGKTGLYNFYKLGQTLYVKCKGLELGAYGGMLELGYKSADPRYETGYIDAQYLINRQIFAGAQGSPLVPKTVAITEFNADMVGTLVKLENLTFSRTDFLTPVSPTYNFTDNPLHPKGYIETWALPNPADGSVPRTVSQIFNNNSSRQIVVRTSGYARFAGTAMPTAPCDLIGILTIFNNTYQLTLRSTTDVIVR